jgi:ubiquinone/menaquinone biosynthesis C-methylase UbiE
MDPQTTTGESAASGSLQAVFLAARAPFDFPDALIINGVEFLPQGGDPGGIYLGPPQDRRSYVSLVFGSRRAAGELPAEITLSGSRYIRKCEAYYLPLDARPADVEHLFDHVAPTYDMVIETDLNSLVDSALLRAAVLGRSFPSTGSLRILDFGCGSGAIWEELGRLARVSPEFARVDLDGCDLSRQMVQASHRRGFIQAAHSQYARTPYLDESFDIVLATFVLHYILDEAPIAEISRVLRPGGELIAAVPARERERLARYESLLAREPSLVSIRTGEIDVPAARMRRIPTLICRKAGESLDGSSQKAAHHPDELFV